MTEYLPRWNFWFRNGETEPYAVNVIQIDEAPGYPTKVTLLQAVTPGDIVKVSLSLDSYKDALHRALVEYEGVA